MMATSLPGLRAELAEACDQLTRPVRVMEVCGTHTVSIFRSGLRSLLPDKVRLISGPGCPVCVTAQGHIDAAIELATRPGVTLATYGDMLRVPGRCGSLEALRAAGASVQVVYSIRDAVQFARNHPDRQVVFIGVGFETTAPATAAAIREAAAGDLTNFSVLPAHKLVVPAMLALLQDGTVPLDGFLCPGHVSVIIGSDAYRPIVERHGRPCVVAGFEPSQILTGLTHLIRQISQGRAELENVYPAAVSPEGNRVARQLIDEVFMPASAAWRAMGEIPASGLDIRPGFERFDALKRFDVVIGPDDDPPGCRCGEVIQGKVLPTDCTLFGRRCTTRTPVGPCMVSSEGTCAAWFKYGDVARVGTVSS
ncbi:MAG: hydrogenase formation protein HypD [bacterium]|nr:hydrogenase formation protein HypD [bacterium]